VIRRLGALWEEMEAGPAGAWIISTTN
jgi:hypothetical protein